MQPGDVDRTWADLTRSAAELSFQPRTSFEDGVRRQWEWMQATPATT
jgi:UDP-glucuronate 4-epimerase